MSRSRLMGASLLLLLGSQAAAQAGTCSSSTLVSSTYAVARWCGDPPNAGTLRMTLRGGAFAEYANVPLDVFRTVVRTHDVAGYVSNTVQPQFERLSGPVASAAEARTKEQRHRAELHRAAPPRGPAQARQPSANHAAAEPRRTPGNQVITPVSTNIPPRSARPERAPAARSTPAAVRPAPEASPLLWRGRPVGVPTRASTRPACDTPAPATKVPARNPACRG